MELVETDETAQGGTSDRLEAIASTRERAHDRRRATSSTRGLALWLIMCFPLACLGPSTLSTWVN